MIEKQMKQIQRLGEKPKCFTLPSLSEATYVASLFAHVSNQHCPIEIDASIPINRLTLVYLNGNLLVLHSPNAYEKPPFGNIHLEFLLSFLWSVALLVHPL